MICGWRNCDVDFEPRDPAQKYCRRNHAHRAQKLRRGENSQRSSQKRKKNRRRKRQLLELQGWICPWCRLPILSIDDASLDHIIPASHGGTRTLSNSQALHIPCNLEKGDRCPGCPGCNPDGGRYREVA